MTMDEFRKMRGMVEPEKKQEQPRRGRKPKEPVEEQEIVDEQEPAGNPVEE